MTIRYRGLISFLLVVGAMVCGLALGTFIGGRYFVPAGSGLAGGFIALGYGVIGAALAGGVALIPVFKMKGRGYLLVAVPVIAAGVVLSGAIGLRILDNKREQDTYLANQRGSLPAYTLDLEYLSPTRHTPFARFEFDSRQRQFHVTRKDDSTCSGSFEPTSEDKLTLLVALRHVEVLLARNPSPCEVDGEGFARLSFRISETLPPDTTGDIMITGNCLSRHEELLDALETIERAHTNLEPECR